MKEVDNTGSPQAKFEDPCIKEAEEAQSSLQNSSPTKNSESQKESTESNLFAKRANPQEKKQQSLRASLISSLEKPKSPLLRWGIQHQLKVMMLMSIGWQVLCRLGFDPLNFLDHTSSYSLLALLFAYFAAQIPMFIQWCHYLQKLQRAAAALPEGRLRFSPLKTRITNLLFGPHSISIALTTVALFINLFLFGAKPNTLSFLQNLIAAGSLVLIGLTAPLMIGGIFYLELFSDINRKIEANNGSPPMPAFLASLIVTLGLLCPSFFMVATLITDFTPFTPLLQAIGILAAFKVSDKYGDCLQQQLTKAAKISEIEYERARTSPSFLANLREIPMVIFNLIPAIDKLKFWHVFAITLTVMLFQGFFHLGLALFDSNEKFALRDINSAIDLNPTNSQNFSMKASIEERLGAPEAALTSIEKAMKLAPTKRELRLEKFKLLAFHLNRFADAYKIIDQEINDCQKDGRDYLLLKFFQNRIWLDALRNDQKALAGDTEIYKKLKKTQYGQQIKQALKLESENKIENAVETLRGVDQLIDDEVIELKARMLKKQNDRKGAIRCYTAPLTTMPEKVQRLPLYSQRIAKYKQALKRLGVGWE
ncbi:MAG: hypothetical protein K2X27_09970 [Candidatus Obscuribacterales bacterium]|nr:hypothetical protein [Candidatus Obscuribacterales bacterium]